MGDRDSLQRDLNKTFQSEREYLRRLGELALASSLNSFDTSLTRNKNVNVSESSLNRAIDNRDMRASTIIDMDMERDREQVGQQHQIQTQQQQQQQAQQHFQQHRVAHLERSNTDITSNKPSQSKEFSSASGNIASHGVKLRKHESFSEKHRSATLDVLPQDLYHMMKLNEAGSGYAVTGKETIKRHYQSIIRKYETLKDEYETLRTKYSELLASHGGMVSKVEMVQDEHVRLRKLYEDSIGDRNMAIRERNGLQQQCTAAIRQWDKALRENNELKEQLAKVQHQRDEAMKEINQAMAARIKATKDMARLTEERNSAVQEYSLIMSERDSVHKEIEKLQEELTDAQKRASLLENERRVMNEEAEHLKREIVDRDRLLKVCSDLREKYGEHIQSGMSNDHFEPISPTSPSRPFGLSFFRSSSSGVSSSWTQIMSKSNNHNELKPNYMSAASSSSSLSTFSNQNQNKLSSNTRIDNLAQANHEIESTKKQCERLQVDLHQRQQELEVCKQRRDWAFTERDKIVLERESIRTLCDRLRRERDRAVSDLAEALRDMDDIQRQKNDSFKELKELKEKLEAHQDESRHKAAQQNGQSQFGATNNTSRDSAIEADQEYETENNLQEFDVVGESNKRERADMHLSSPTQSQTSSNNSKDLQMKTLDRDMKHLHVSQRQSKSKPDSSIDYSVVSTNDKKILEMYKNRTTTTTTNNATTNTNGNNSNNNNNMNVKQPLNIMNPLVQGTHHYLTNSGMRFTTGSVRHAPSNSHAQTHSHSHSQVHHHPHSHVPHAHHSHHHSMLAHSTCDRNIQDINNTSYSSSPTVTDGLPTLPDGLATLPKRSQRIRIPSNPSVTSSQSKVSSNTLTGAVKLSSGSIDKASSMILSDRGSPMPACPSFSVEWVNSGSNLVNNHEHMANHERRPKMGDVRSIYIEKISEPLGIQISCDTVGTGIIFVSHVNVNSLAEQVGLMVGDQLLEVCGINMRNATYQLAANVLRQCGDSISMLVQYNPDKYKENLPDNLVDTSDDDEADDEDDEMEDEEEEEESVSVSAVKSNNNNRSSSLK